MSIQTYVSKNIYVSGASTHNFKLGLLYISCIYKSLNEESYVRVSL